MGCCNTLTSWMSIRYEILDHLFIFLKQVLTFFWTLILYFFVCLVGFCYCLKGRLSHISMSLFQTVVEFSPISFFSENKLPFYLSSSEYLATIKLASRKLLRYSCCKKNYSVFLFLFLLVFIFCQKV